MLTILKIEKNISNLKFFQKLPLLLMHFLITEGGEGASHGISSCLTEETASTNMSRQKMP